MKQKMYQQLVYKVESSRILGSEKKNLIITPRDARLNDEIISLAGSNVLRAIDELNGVDRTAVAEKISGIRGEIGRLRLSVENKAAARNRIKALYTELDELQLKSDYIMVVMSKPSDFDKLNKGFSVNGVEYRRLVGTPNGVKKSTVVYCPVINANGVRIHEELDKRMNGGRDETKELVPAKFEAYKALACSASVPVSMPRDILVVDDFVLSFVDDFIQLENTDDSEEPVMTEKRGEFELNASDGFGLMSPELAERWSKELELGYTAGGMCIRNLFCKGMVYAFDFHEFARRYGNGDTITDIWGDVHTVSDVELILPVSVMKLWDSYGSLSHYLEMCEKYGHGFSVTKTCEKELENERTLNYQFIQSYDLTDDEIKELVQPSIDEIKETVCGDADKTLLFLRGACGKDYDFDADTNYLAKAIMIEPRVAKDPYAITTVYNMIKKRIDELKIGKVKVHGNYTLISGDPFAFCQKIFGCDVPDEEKGLLRAGEMYSKYWVDDSGGLGKKVVCFRAPMSCHNNIRTMGVVRNEDIDFWYRYMNTVNIINCHDAFYAAENGADNDGDAILTTDNEILLRNTRDVPAIVCVQKKAEKCVITEERLALANKNSFGDEIGAITNRVTAMYDIMTKFERGSPQYHSLEYRIKCGQLLQQDCIDKCKGIVSKPMPKMWYDIHSVVSKEDDDDYTAKKKAYNKQIIASKKPYFMIYIYSQLKREVRRFIMSAESGSRVRYGLTLGELLAKTDRSEEQEKFVLQYYKYYPVFDENGVMNRLCHYVEREFDGFLKNTKNKGYSYRELLISDNFELNTKSTPYFKKINDLYVRYKGFMKDVSVFTNIQYFDSRDLNSWKCELDEWFKRECDCICVSEKRQCDILLKLCYSNENSKRFVWKMCGDRIIRNLLEKNKEYSYFIRDESGDTVYGGIRYKKIRCVCNKGDDTQ
ncbi:MAG: hypothetical protein K2N38_01210 [Oscillospiraceae bacterium]|nr:hypothetical protein [Oscillospiraceae bacterium]